MMRYGPDHIINIVGLSGCGKSTFTKNVFGTKWNVFRPSDLLRENASRFGIVITDTQDYVDIHQALADEDPDFMTRPILALRGLVVVDGLRNLSHASTLAGVLGKNYHTTALVCPDEVRLQRLKERAERPESAPQTIPQMHALDSVIPSHYQFDKVLAMADLPVRPIDTSRDPAETAARYALMISSVIHNA